METQRSTLIKPLSEFFNESVNSLLEIGQHHESKRIAEKNINLMSWNKKKLNGSFSQRNVSYFKLCTNGPSDETIPIRFCMQDS